MITRCPEGARGLRIANNEPIPGKVLSAVRNPQSAIMPATPR